MKISTNPIGNYNPYNMKVSNVRKTIQTPKVAETQKTTELNSASPLSKEERSFFVKMYPDNKQEIVDHHFYKSSGKMSGVSIGSLFDKRG